MNLFTGMMLCLLNFSTGLWSDPALAKGDRLFDADFDKTLDDTIDGLKVKKPSKSRKSGRLRYGLGIGLNVPDLVPLEGWVRFGNFAALRLFVVPEIPFNIRVEMPDDEVGGQDNITVAHPDLIIPFDAVYGPQYGVEAAFFPFGGTFYVGGGVSFRKLRLKGLVESSLILKTDSAAGSTETNSIFSIGADGTTSQYVLRTSLGFFWELRGGSYFNLVLLGLTQPYKAGSTVTVTADMTNPKAVNPTADKALDAFKADKEIEMEDKALIAMRPAEELVLPMIGLSIGILL